MTDAKPQKERALAEMGRSKANAGADFISEKIACHCIYAPRIWGLVPGALTPPLPPLPLQRMSAWNVWSFFHIALAQIRVSLGAPHCQQLGHVPAPSSRETDK